MSDLQCAVRVIVVRHGDAEYDVAGILSDDGGWLTPAGRAQAAELAESLRDERVAAIWCSDYSRAVQTAEIVAARLGVAVKVRAGLHEFLCGDFAGHPLEPNPLADVVTRWSQGDDDAAWPGGESAAQIFERMRVEFEALADQYRGETVLVVSHGGVMHVGIPRLASNVDDGFAFGLPIDNCRGGVIEGDSDGWRLVSWLGTAL